MPEFHVTSLDDDLLNPYRDLRRTNENRYLDVFIAEGVTVVERLLRSPFQVQSLLVTEGKRDQIQALVPADLPVIVVTRDLASMLVGYSFHQGVLAAGRRNSVTLSDVFRNRREEIQADNSRLILVGHRIIDRQNVGLLIRIASAFGAEALVLSEGSADPFSRRAIRVSMGNGLFFPVVTDTDVSEVLTVLKSQGYQTVATVLNSSATGLDRFRFSGASAIVFGNETHGLPQEIIDACGEQVVIDMLNQTDSLNIAIAAGIFSHAFRCQHPGQ